ncbi:MAG: antibiotic biosynthesis monooxygenase [Candidatus Baltobacteraceae bacterium]
MKTRRAASNYRRLMVEIFYRYRVHPSQARAFEHAYGSTGPWTLLFKKHPGYRRTRLFRHGTQAGIYLTIDVWDDKASWDEFRRIFLGDYQRLDKQLALLHLEEHLLGFYDGTQEPYP